jgi:uncharacterized OB-fold protein
MRAQRPLPQFDSDTEPFWRAAGEGKLVIQHCPVTGTYQHPPRPFMAGCGFDWEWKEVPGTGTVYSYTVVHAPADPAFPTPYAVAVVDLDVANVRMVGQVRDIAADAVKIGLRVQVRFEAAEEIGVPYFVAV